MATQVTNRARAAVVVAFIVMAVLLLASTVQATDGASGTDTTEGNTMAAAEQRIEYTVRSGDNLWAIAETVTPAGVDVRSTISEIRSINGLSGTTIYSGQVLVLPDQ